MKPLSATLKKRLPMLHDKIVLGRKTLIDLIDFEMYGIVAKVDTGAYKNALHCSKVEVVSDGKHKYLSFHVLDGEHPQYNNKLITVKNFSKTRVVNSFGHSQTRYVVTSRLRVHGIDDVFEAEFTLADRSQLKAPILLGRKFLRHRFLVDVAS